MRYHHNSTDWIANPLKAKAAESDLKEPKYFHLFFSFEIIAIIKLIIFFIEKNSTNSDQLVNYGLLVNSICVKFWQEASISFLGEKNPVFLRRYY